MIDALGFFFLLYIGYIVLAIVWGRSLGKWLARNTQRSVQILAQVLCIAALLYLPVWDYIPGKILFDRHCAKSGGLQSGPAPWKATNGVSVFFEGDQLGSCRDCIAGLAVQAIDAAEAYVRPLEGAATLIPAEGYIRMTLTARSGNSCPQLADYFQRSPSYSNKTEEQKWAMFWRGRVPGDLTERVDEKCVTWTNLTEPTAAYVLKPRTQRTVPFFWTYLYEVRVELRRRIDQALVASYSVYQYHPWFNTNVFEGPRLFVFRCPNPEAHSDWSRSFPPSRVFIEIMRQRQSTTGSLQ